ncbi:hypothetical protein I6B53_10750 [Schaalia sp. 19OD2882]|uniref:hypothetical protein n=1 Tax=Schaalia sp. 19OD2882 TaxID=2794089 RepID=UPI001C1EA416|nr:hypothetical protein [Schaalia sp. 19OD2882]QWW19536.1 hypothetical protein I6B53_10750 [Schaalia sp. 19OD2882]
MGGSPSIPAQMKTRIVLSVLAGEVSVVEAARREKATEQSIGRWKGSLPGGRASRTGGRPIWPVLT